MDFSVSIVVVYCLWPISSSVVRSGIVVCPLCKIDTSSASAADATTRQSTRNLVWSGPLFIRILGCLGGSADIEIKKIDHPLCFVLLVK